MLFRGYRVKTCKDHEVLVELILDISRGNGCQVTTPSCKMMKFVLLFTTKTHFDAVPKSEIEKDHEKYNERSVTVDGTSVMVRRWYYTRCLAIAGQAEGRDYAVSLTLDRLFVRLPSLTTCTTSLSTCTGRTCYPVESRGR